MLRLYKIWYNIGTPYDFDLVVQEASDLSGTVELEVRYRLLRT